MLLPEDDDREDPDFPEDLPEDLEDALEVDLEEEPDDDLDWYLALEDDVEDDVFVRYVVGEPSEDLYLLFTSLLLYFTSLFL